jgi:hypothetical protein
MGRGGARFSRRFCTESSAVVIEADQELQHGFAAACRSPFGHGAAGFAFRYSTASPSA